MTELLTMLRLLVIFNDATRIILIQLTKTGGRTSQEWSAFRTFPLDTMVAIRGNADVTIYEGGE